MVTNFFNEPIALENVNFLFVLCPNNSGTTIMCQYIAEQTSAYLPPFGNNEGQMIPTVRDIMRNRPWNVDSSFDWAFIRKVWEEKAKGRMFVEGSPPNIIRVDRIRETFGRDSTAILSISDPYQQIASSIRRYARPGYDLKGFVRSWLEKARVIADLEVKYPNFPLVRYDDFVQNPRVINDILGCRVKPTTVTGKRGSGGDGIVNMRPLTTLFLTNGDMDSIAELLEPHRDIVEHFGYAVVKHELLINGFGVGTDIYENAKARRAKWEQKVEVGS